MSSNSKGIFSLIAVLVALYAGFNLGVSYFSAEKRLAREAKAFQAKCPIKLNDFATVTRCEAGPGKQATLHVNITQKGDGVDIRDPEFKATFRQGVVGFFKGDPSGRRLADLGVTVVYRLKQNGNYSEIRITPGEIK